MGIFEDSTISTKFIFSKAQVLKMTSYGAPYSDTISCFS